MEAGTFGSHCLFAARLKSVDDAHTTFSFRSEDGFGDVPVYARSVTWRRG
jgi:hypothetical protein